MELISESNCNVLQETEVLKKQNIPVFMKKNSSCKDLLKSSETKPLKKRPHKCVRCEGPISTSDSSSDCNHQKRRSPLCFNCCKAMINKRPSRKVKKILPRDIKTTDRPLQKRSKGLATCKDCQQVFGSKKSLIKHRASAHKKVRSYSCPDCNQTFDRVNALTSHVAEAHENCKPFMCAECDASFSQKVNLNDHVSSIHRKLKPYRCSECGSTFSRKGHLSKHVTAVHKQIKPYTCSVCDAAFSRKHHMEHHIASVHEKRRPHTCSICDSTFSCKRNLEKHVSSVHMKVKPFHCTECGANFSEKRNLSAHIITKHTQLKLFHCVSCDMHFSLKRYLDHHVATIHKGLRGERALQKVQGRDPVEQLKKHLGSLDSNDDTPDPESMELYSGRSIVELREELDQSFNDRIFQEESHRLLDQQKPLVTAVHDSASESYDFHLGAQHMMAVLDNMCYEPLHSLHAN